MKHVEYYDSKNKQEFSHGGENLTSLSNQCQERQKDSVFSAALCVTLHPLRKKSG